MKRLSLIIAALLLGALSAGAQRYDRGYENFPTREFIPKGTWMVGGSVGYTQHLNRDHNFLIIEDINSDGFHVSAKPVFLYMFKNNMGLGARFSYSRGLLDIESASLSVMGVDLGLKDYCNVSQKYSGAIVYRVYIPIGNANRIAMFAEGQIGGSIGQSKASEAHTGEIVGTFENNYNLHIGVNPGMVAFLADNLAIEASLGIVGVSYNWKDQVRNQIDNGAGTVFSAGFMLNPLDLSIGVTYYIPHKTR
ncbi:MAG: hypothetical protein MJY56_06200 [Bacteroidales bacterium]|nr:hypothetical protein [Bacteroidales bacterium]